MHAVVNDLRSLLKERGLLSVPIVVVDDGSTDGSLSVDLPGVTLLTHPQNRGKGAALMSGLVWAQNHGIARLVTLDADGQHPVEEALRLLLLPGFDHALVLGVRDLAGAGAPLANQRSNNFSNQVLSLFGGQKLLDTQCGLRRYPVEATLKLNSPASGYAFESDVVLRAARTGLEIHHVETQVHYPTGSERVSHFDSVRDPSRIVGRVVLTTLTVVHHRRGRRLFRHAALLFVLVLLAGAWLSRA